MLPQLEAGLILGLAVVLLGTNRLSPELVGLLVMGLVGATGLVPYPSVFGGLANPALVIIASMMILGEALQRTGVAARLGGLVAERVAGQRWTNVLLLVAAALPSALVSDVGVATIFLRMLEGMGDRLGVPRSRVLLPVAFGSILGGLLTILGSSGNILANQFLLDAGGKGLSLFSITPLGLILVTVAAGYVLLWGKRILPERDPVDLGQLYGLRQYRGEATVTEEFPGCGRSLRELAMPRGLNLQILKIERRNGETVDHPRGDTRLLAGDRLLVQGAVMDILRSRGHPEWPGLELAEGREWEVGETDNYAETLVTPDSPLRQHTLGELHFRQRYNLSVLAVSRLGETTAVPGGGREGAGGTPPPANGGRGLWSAGLGQKATQLQRQLRQAVGSIGLREAVGRSRTDKGRGFGGLGSLRFRVGDTLLLHGREEDLDRLGQEGILLLQKKVGYRPVRSGKALPVVAVMAGVILAGATGLLPLAVAAVLGVTIVLLVGCLTFPEAQGALEVRPLVLLAGMLALGGALERTGLVTAATGWMLGMVGGGGPYLLLAGVYVGAALVTQFLTNAVTVVLMTPLAIQAAAGSHLDPVPFVVAVMVAVSASPVTPFSNQVNLLVMGPGRYRPADYLRAGLPLALILGLVSLVLIPVFWPFAGAAVR